MASALCRLALLAAAPAASPLPQLFPSPGELLRPWGRITARAGTVSRLNATTPVESPLAAFNVGGTVEAFVRSRPSLLLLAPPPSVARSTS